MGYSKVFDDMIESKLLDMHTAYIGKVISVGAEQTTATVQPLGLYKQYGVAAQKQAIVSNIPVIATARNKLIPKEITYIESATISTTTASGYLTGATLNPVTKTETVVQLSPLAAGDIVLCVCCDRDISQSRKGINAVPAAGHNSLSDSVVVGVI